MADAARIIIVEDNIPFARAVARGLECDGYVTVLAPSGAELRRIYRSQGADLILLDLGLSGEDGIDLAVELTRTTPVAVIIMTGRDEIVDRIRGLDAGADDYVTKPFAQGELNARIRAVLRRRQPVLAQDTTLRFGPVQLDANTRQVRCDGVADAAELTEMETAMLDHLMRAGGRPVERGALMQRVNWDPTDRAADVHIGHIGHIRRKLSDAGIDVLTIWAVRGRGYRLALRGESDEKEAAEGLDRSDRS
ncbi:response regulator transcription factor [uncultured Lamprocystis sp.]|jgi:DNA-binding response OmpR family regulator|uniref:response regulator transcription factor n=1 Tax=uncultured Lamprocystis sp. TaxID=543132 RepID=UPI0025FAB2E9|nr:response regulator transcription factor [uncultured Lamprocystis sp.]